MITTDFKILSKIRFLIFLYLLLLCSLPLVMAQEGQSGDSIIIPRLKGQFTFDGTVDDECWANATKLPAVMQIPVFGQPPSQETDFLITYDDSYIYLAGRMYDKTPEKIMSTTRIRDDWTSQGDFFTCVFDTFNDNENGLVFAINPEGVRLDGAILNDAIDNQNPVSSAWNTFWDAKTSLNNNGWFAEIRIPLSSMRFQSQNDKVVMGLIVFRWKAESSELDIFPSIPAKWAVSWMKVSQAKHVVFNGIRSRKAFYVAPYALTGINQESELTPDGNSRKLASDPQLTGGLDIKYGLTHNLTLDLSLNTDFAQVESDNVQINLTRFNLFYPEKRTFFLERSSNFSFAFDEKNNLFYSRRIGLADDQYPVPIYGGARIVGRAGNWDIGFLDMQTKAFEHTSDSLKDLTSENFGILRLRRQVFNSNSYAGGIITSRIGTNGSYNTNCGLDGIFRMWGENYLDVKYVQTFDDAFKNKTDGFNNSRIWIDVKNRKSQGFGYDISAGHSGKYFLPGCGYEQRADFNQAGANVLYSWLMKPEKKVYDQTFILMGQQWTENKTNNVQTRTFGLDYRIGMKSMAVYEFIFGRTTENITEAFTIMGSATVPPGKYDYNSFTFYTNSAMGKKHFFQSTSTIGQFYDGSLLSILVYGSYSFGSGFKAEATYEYDRVRFPSRNEKADGHIFGLRPVLMFNTKLSLTAFIQYFTVENSIITNLRLRYNPREGNDFYIVFNEGYNTSVNTEVPPLQRIAGRALMLKYTYTFVL